MPSPQKENDPPVPVQPPFSELHFARCPVCSAVLLTHGSETQLYLSHAVGVWQTTGITKEKTKHKVVRKERLYNHTKTKIRCKCDSEQEIVFSIKYIRFSKVYVSTAVLSFVGYVKTL